MGVSIFRFFRSLYEGVVQRRALYHAFYDRLDRVPMFKVLNGVVFVRCVSRLQRHQYSPCALFVLGALRALLRRFFSSRHGIVPNSSFQSLVRVRGRHCREYLSIANRRYSRLVLSHLSSTLCFNAGPSLYSLISSHVVRGLSKFCSFFGSALTRLLATCVCR